MKICTNVASLSELRGGSFITDECSDCEILRKIEIIIYLVIMIVLMEEDLIEEVASLKIKYF
jgi:hypothetical protein